VQEQKKALHVPCWQIANNLQTREKNEAGTIQIQMKNKKVRFYTGDIETKGGLLGDFLMGGVFDGKRYREFDNEDDFMGFILGIKGTIFFHFLEFDIKSIWQWCEKNGIEIESIPKLSGDKQVIEWKFKDVVFRDSFALTRSSLSALSLGFNLKTKKIPMDTYHFAKRTEKLKRYLKNDVISLHEAMTKFYQFIGWQHFTRMSIASIAMAKFKEIDLQAYKRIIESPIYMDMDKFIREAFFTGYFKTFDANIEKETTAIWDIDVNSYYASMMRGNPFPLGGIIETKNREEIQSLMENKLGIIQARMIVPKGLKLGFLPVRKENGIDYPTRGRWEGSWTTPEIVFAKNLGYQFIFRRGVFWQFQDRLFDKYINYLAKIKEHSRGAKQAIVKQMAVSFYGKFSQRRQMSVLKHSKELGINIPHVVYVRTPFSHAEISVFTTAYARIFTYVFCEEVGWKNILSVNADAVIFKGEMSKRFRKRWIHPVRFGKFKIVSDIKKAIILKRGVYALKDTKGKEIIRNQGANSEFSKLLTFDDFEKAKKKRVWIQYRKIKRPNSVYHYLTRGGKIKSAITESRKIRIKSR